MGDFDLSGAVLGWGDFGIFGGSGQRKVSRQGVRG